MIFDDPNSSCKNWGEYDEMIREIKEKSLNNILYRARWKMLDGIDGVQVGMINKNICRGCKRKCSSKIINICR
jgi:hypothetical protein